MATSRYWRLRGVQTYAGGDLALSALQLVDGAGTVLSAAVSCTLAPTVGAVANLTDENPGTGAVWSAAAVHGPAFALVLDAGADVTEPRLRLAGPDLARWAHVLSLDGLVNDSWMTVADAAGLVWPGPGVLTDQPVQYIAVDGADACHLRFEGVHGSTAIVDDVAGHAWACYGGAQLTTVAPLDGTASLDLNGPGRYAICPAHSDFQLGVGAFTLRLRLRLAADPSGFTPIISRSSPTPHLWREWALYLSGPSLYFYHGVRANHNIDLRFAGEFKAGVYELLIGRDAAGYWRGWNNGGAMPIVATSGVGAPAVGAPNTVDLSDSSGTMGLQLGLFSADMSVGVFVPGQIDSVRLRRGEPPPNAPYAPSPGMAFGSSKSPAAGPLGATCLRARCSNGRVALTSFVADGSTALIRGLFARDMEFGGAARISGDVGIKGVNGAPDTMTRSRVRLLRQRDGLLARETWSDPLTGAFAFEGVDQAQKFIALAEDKDGVFAPVAADRRTPETPA